MRESPGRENWKSLGNNFPHALPESVNTQSCLSISTYVKQFCGCYSLKHLYSLAAESKRHALVVGYLVQNVCMHATVKRKGEKERQLVSSSD